MPDQTFEQRFSNLAELHVKDKVPALMDKWVGFQLIHKSDDEKNATGVMAFVLDKLWLYIPVIFIEGELKGSDILYVKNIDLKVPAQNNWINSLKDKGVGILGTLMDESQDQDLDGVDDISIPVEEFAVKEAADSLIDEETIAKMFSSQKIGDTPFLDKIAMLGDDAVGIFTRTFLDNPEFTNAVFTFHAPEEFDKLSSMLVDIENRRRTTAAPDNLQFIRNMEDKRAEDLSDSEKKVLLRNGLFIKDSREVHSMVFSAAEPFDTLCSPDQSGEYQVLMRNGEYQPMHVFLNSGGDIIILDEGKCECTEAGKVLGRFVSDELPEMKTFTRQAYAENADKAIIVTDGKATYLIYRYGKDSVQVDGFGQASLAFTGAPGALSIHHSILLVPENAKFLTAEKGHHNLGDLDTVNDALRTSREYLPMEMTHTKAGTIIEAGSEKIACQGRTETLERLTRDLGIFAGQAQQLYNEVEREGSGRWYIKTAAPMDEGIFSPVKGGEIQTTVEIHTSPEMETLIPQKTVQTLSSAAETGLQEVFDVSVFKSLLQAANVGEFKQEFLQDMIRGMDSTAGILLLMYWNYDMFEERYGEELDDVEARLKDVFTNMGDLILYLKDRMDVMGDGGESVWGLLSEDM